MNEPNPTLYVSNIDWKIKKTTLRRSLHTLFNRHGKILEIIALRKDGLRGQAFVIFDNVASATAAIQAEQGFTFFGKDLRIEYAREKSDRVAKRDGTFIPKDRRVKRIATKSSTDLAPTKVTMDDINNSLVTSDKIEVSTDSDPSSVKKDGIDETEEKIQEEQSPSKILFAESLPSDCNEMMLSCLFRSYSGYKEVRIPRSGLAFIEFDDEPQATIALKALNKFKLSSTDTLNLKYSKS